MERISKEQLYTAYCKVQSRYTKYKGRYVDLARHYRELDRENVKAKVQNLKAIYYVSVRTSLILEICCASKKHTRNIVYLKRHILITV